MTDIFRCAIFVFVFWASIFGAFYFGYKSGLKKRFRLRIREEI